MSRDPYAHLKDDPSGIDDWLRSKGHDIKRPVDPTNEWNRPLRQCQLPSCGALIEDRLPGAKYCSRAHKEEHTYLRQKVTETKAE